MTSADYRSALESALMLAEFCPKVYLINKNPKFKGDDTLIEKATANPVIDIRYNAVTTNILGTEKVAGIEYRKEDGTVEKLGDVEGVFVHIGSIPNSDLAPESVQKDKFGNIIVDMECRTSVPGLYAAGDVTNIPFKQIVIAAGQGATAALSVVTYLNGRK